MFKEVEMDPSTSLGMTFVVRYEQQECHFLLERQGLEWILLIGRVDPSGLFDLATPATRPFL